MKSLLVFGYGNPGRGDDGLGPAFADAIEAMGLSHVECLNDMQLQVEHVMDMQNRDLVLFVDADASCDAPFVCTPIKGIQDDSYSSHAMTPHALLFAYQNMFNESASPVYLLRIRGLNFELGDVLSAQAKKHLSQSIAMFEKLIQCPDTEQWNKAAPYLVS